MTQSIVIGSIDHICTLVDHQDTGRWDDTSISQHP